MRTAVKIWMIAAWLATVTALEGASFLGVKLDKGGDAMLADLKEIQADEWEWKGKTMVLRRNIRIPYQDLVFYADAAIIDTENRDIELSGNIQLYRIVRSDEAMSIQDLNRVMGLNDLYVSITGYQTDGLGRQNIKTNIYSPGEVITATRMTGNLATGVFTFADMSCNFGSFYASAAAGERKPGGEITLSDVEVTTCNYLVDDRAHYSVSCETVNIFPHEAGDGLRGYNADQGEHSFWAYNCWVKAYDIPMIWLPVFYKPKDESLGLFQLAGGESSDYGYYMSVSRKFRLMDYPEAWIRPRLDWYEKRGVGYGATGGIISDDSKTTLYAYGISDLRPYENSEVEDYRLEIPTYRYRLALDHVTHVTPRLDFRSKFNVQSDYYFSRDYFGSDFDNDPEPASYAALEYQFDRASLSLLGRPQVNSFYTTAQQLPQLKLAMPRQELFGTGLYYEGTHSIEYLDMRWREFDKPRPKKLPNPKNYETMRFDSVNFLYYPFKLFEAVNITPRAGIRFTDYNASSDQPVSDSDIGNMISVEEPTSLSRATFNNYDRDGGNRFRVAGELGLEANTKFYRAWQNVRSPFLNMDGLRHVIEPFTNYTFIPKPSEDREYLYYFDDTDRIKEMNFVRFGVKNRLQTRRGSVTKPELYNWLSMENYWDLFFKKENDYNNVGDVGTIIKFTPGNGFSMSAECSFDLGNNYERVDYYRQGRNVGRPGLDIPQLNYLSLNMQYALLDDLIFGVRYNYEDAYRSRSIYSMGSSLTNLDACSAWERYVSTMTQEVVFSVQFPITPQRDLKGVYEITYDFYRGSISEQSLQLIKTLHCWDVVFEVSQDEDWDSDRRSYEKEYSFRVMAYLNGMISPLQRVRSQMINSARNYQQKTGREQGSFAFY